MDAFTFAWATEEPPPPKSLPPKPVFRSKKGQRAKGNKRKAIK